LREGENIPLTLRKSEEEGEERRTKFHVHGMVILPRIAWWALRRVEEALGILADGQFGAERVMPGSTFVRPLSGQASWGCLRGGEWDSAGLG
jgi:hypothetical protein